MPLQETAQPHLATPEHIKPEGRVKTEEGQQGTSSQQQRDRDGAMQVALPASSKQEPKAQVKRDLGTESTASLGKSKMPDPGRYRFQNQEINGTNEYDMYI